MPESTEPFAHTASPVHSLDPRFRLLAAVVLTVPAALLTSPVAAGGALLVGALLAFAARLPFGRLAKRLLAVNFFTLFMWIFLPFSTPGTPLTSVVGLEVTLEGLRLAGLITLKTNAVVLSLTALMGSIPVRDLGPAMQSLRVPDKLCHMLVFTHRYAVLIREELDRMNRAARARGFRPRTDMHTYRSYAWLAGMLLVRSWDRAERVRDAMICRGFSGRFHSLAIFRTSGRDVAFLTLILLVAAGLIWLEFIRRTA